MTKPEYDITHECKIKKGKIISKYPTQNHVLCLCLWIVKKERVQFVFCRTGKFIRVAFSAVSGNEFFV